MTTTGQKFKIYVRPGGKMKVKAKTKTQQPKLRNPSAVAFVLRHISGRSYEDQLAEANRLLNVVEHTPADRQAIEQILQSRCRKSQ